MRGEIFVAERAEECRRRILPPQPLEFRPLADDGLGARQVERQERIEILLDRDASDGHEDRPRQTEIDGAVRAEELRVDAARPRADIGEATARQFVVQRLGRHHGHRRRIVEAPQHRVAPGFRDRHARRNVFREFRGVARGEGQRAPDAIAPYGVPDRTFRGNVDRVRRDRLDPPRDLARIRDRTAQVLIGRDRERRKAVGREEFDRCAAVAHRFRQCRQRAHHAIDLRMPGIRRHQNSHRFAHVIFELHGATMAASHFSRVTAQSCDLEGALGRPEGAVSRLLQRWNSPDANCSAS